MSQNIRPKTVTEYINTFPITTQERLNEMFNCLREVAHGAKEYLKWGQPALSYDWILFQFASFKSHISLYPTPQAIKAFEKELSKYITSSSTIQFPLDKPLPTTLIRNVASFRIQEAKNGIKWK